MVLIKRKTVSKVAKTFKASAKAKEITTVAEAKAKDVATTPKLLKKPAGALLRATALKMMKKPAAAAEKKEDEEEEVEDEEQEEGKATMKKPAAAGKAKSKMEVDEEEEDSSEDEDEAEDEEEEDEEEEAATGAALKKPAAAGAAKKAEADEDEEEDDEEDEDEEDEDEEDEEEAEVSSKAMKRPAAAGKVAAKEAEDDEDEEESEDDEDEEEEDTKDGQIVPFETEKEKTEKEITAERTKELKAMAASDLKELLLGNGLEKGTKEEMIKTLCKFEAKQRVVAREQKAKIRTIVIAKKQELENLSIPELGKLCNDKGMKGLKAKPERVQRLLLDWQENEGVDKALVKIALDDRKTDLEAMDITKLRKLCNKLGVDPFVKEVMVERIGRQEFEKGLYARPAMKDAGEEVKEEKKVDMVDALLANEAQRKKERALQLKQEEAIAQKRKELKAMSAEDLKKKLTKKGLDASGKREDMMESLFIALMQEDALAARKTELQGKSAQELKELIVLNGLEAGGKDQMLKTLLAHEAKCREDLKVFEEKVNQVAAQKQVHLEKQSNAKLKDMCVEKGLPAKGEKEERIQRLIDEQKKEGSFDKVVSVNSRDKRQAELMAMDKAAVLKLCEKTGVDPHTKGIMVERIMAFESESGEAIAADDEPATKKARTSRK